MVWGVAGWAITEWAVAITAIVGAISVVWRTVVMPVRQWWRSFKAWMVRIESATAWTEQQMKPNGGGTLVDKVNEMREQVALILDHDDERDVQGLRYSDADTEDEDEDEASNTPTPTQGVIP